MSWKASNHMTATDHRAVLASWGIAPPPGADKPILKELVEKVYANIMVNPPLQRLFLAGAMAFSGAFPAGSSSVASGTDEPKSEFQVIYSDEPDEEVVVQPDIHVIYSNEPGTNEDRTNEPDHNVIWNIQNHLVNVIHDASGASVSAAPEIGSTSAEGNQSAACASAPEVFVPSLRRALLLEEAATADAEANAKVKAKTTKAKGKSKSKMLYGYLPMAGISIDEDLKKKGPDDKNDHGNIVV